MRRVKANQKGKSRHFSSPEEIQSQMAKIDLKDGENSDEEEASSSAAGSDSSDESGSDSDEGNRGKPKGVSALIEIENPNRAPKKASPAEPVQLSRREKEEIEKQKAKERYQKLHAAGKTDQAKADLARLAMIRQKREEEAAKKREEARMKDEKGKRAGSSK